MKITDALMVKDNVVVSFNLDSIDDMPKSISSLVINDKKYNVINTDYSTSITDRVNFFVMIDKKDNPSELIGKEALLSV